MKNKLILIVCLGVVMSVTGCKKFLDVTPKSSISETELFSSEEGFQQGLTGIYSQLASPTLYGDNLTLGFTSALAQNYNPANAFFIFKQTTALNFNSGEVVSIGSTIWRDAYAAIAGVDNILAQIDSKKEMFRMNNYNLIKGEALGLRAYLHFDLLRLYGENYETGAQKKAVPYRNTMDASPKPPSTVEEVTILVLADLADAAEILKNTDPIVNGDKSRKNYMNYMAIKGLEARVYLYKGDKGKAAAAAGEVVNSDEYTFVTNAQISASGGNRDRLFSNELVFTLEVKNLSDWTETGLGYFKAAGDNRNDLTRTGAQFNSLYETGSGGSTDYRYVYLLENDGNLQFPSKYWGMKRVPLIRLSEMFYILAETASTPEEGVGFLNMVRKNRGLAELPEDVNADKLTSEIKKEYQKEFLAEGQLFYYYKRTRTQKMLFNNSTLTDARYILPIPDSELEFNPNYN